MLSVFNDRLRRTCRFVEKEKARIKNSIPRIDEREGKKRRRKSIDDR